MRYYLITSAFWSCFWLFILTVTCSWFLSSTTSSFSSGFFFSVTISLTFSFGCRLSWCLFCRGPTFDSLLCWFWFFFFVIILWLFFRIFWFRNWCFFRLSLLSATTSSWFLFFNIIFIILFNDWGITSSTTARFLYSGLIILLLFIFFFTLLCRGFCFWSLNCNKKILRIKTCEQ